MIYKALATAFIIIGGLAVLYYAVLIISALIPKKRRYRRIGR
jgi:hypothetical protein